MRVACGTLIMFIMLELRAWDFEFCGDLAQFLPVQAFVRIDNISRLDWEMHHTPPRIGVIRPRFQFPLGIIAGGKLFPKLIMTAMFYGISIGVALLGQNGIYYPGIIHKEEN